MRVATRIIDVFSFANSRGTAVELSHSTSRIHAKDICIPPAFRAITEDVDVRAIRHPRDALTPFQNEWLITTSRFSVVLCAQDQDVADFVQRLCTKVDFATSTNLSHFLRSLHSNPAISFRQYEHEPDASNATSDAQTHDALVRDPTVRCNTALTFCVAEQVAPLCKSRAQAVRLSETVVGAIRTKYQEHLDPEVLEILNLQPSLAKISFTRRIGQFLRSEQDTRLMAYELVKVASQLERANEAIDEMLQLGGTPLLVRLTTDAQPHVQEQATRCLARVTSDEELAMEIVSCGGIDALLHACASGTPATKEHAMLALAELSSLAFAKKNMRKSNLSERLSASSMLDKSPSIQACTHEVLQNIARDNDVGSDESDEEATDSD